MNLYNGLKHIIKNTLPKKILFRFENHFRFLHSLFYLGKSYQCNICNRNLRQFIILDDEKICPACGSLKRTRRLWNILENEFLNDSQQRILHFSPSRSIYRKLKNHYPNYTGSDLSDDFLSDESFDITNINISDNYYDLIICYHILEHVENDSKAISELHRVLKDNKFCLIQTPFKDGEIYEDASITDPEQRNINFGQHDHLRIYSANGLKDRLEKTGFNVEIREFHELPKNKYGFSESEEILICKK